MKILPWTQKHRNPSAQIFPPKPYQEAWLLAFECPFIEKIVLEKSARVGYAIFINTTTAWIVANDPDNILIVENTETDAGKFAEGEIGKVFEHCPPVAARLIKGAKKTATEKTYLGGRLIVGWATSASTFRMVTIKYFFADEVSGWPDNVDKEGSGLKNGIVRTETEDERKIVIGSTPKLAGSCKVTKEFKKTDQRYFYIPCPHCGHKQRLKLANLRYQTDDFKSAYFTCENCTGEIKEHHKFQFIRKGEWRATRKFKCCGVNQTPAKWDEKGTALCRECNRPGDTNERGKVDAGFHIWTAYNDNANTSIPALAKEYHEAKEEPYELMQSFMNTWVGVEYTHGAKHHQIKGFDTLHKRRTNYEPLELLPEGIKAIFCSADTQLDRFDYHVWGVGEHGEIWAIDYGQIQGDPEETSTQDRLIKVFESEYILVDGRWITAFACILDCNGHAWQSMLEFCSDYDGWLYAIRGSADKKARASNELTMSKNRHQEADCEYRTINVHKLKNKAAELINNSQPGKRFVHFPNTDVFDLWYFKMLTSEELRGVGLDARWHPKKGQKRNEAWDLLVYGLWLFNFFRSDINAASTKEPLGLVTKNDSYNASEEVEHSNDYYEVNDVY